MAESSLTRRVVASTTIDTEVEIDVPFDAPQRLFADSAPGAEVDDGSALRGEDRLSNLAVIARLGVLRGRRALVVFRPMPILIAQLIVG